MVGNPGLGGFYVDFMQSLYKNLETKVPIWCISHAGHYDLPGVFPLKGKYKHFLLVDPSIHKKGLKVN